MRTFINKAKNKYNIKRDLDFWLIMATYSVAGMNIGFCRRRIYAWTGLNHASLWVKIALFVIFFFPFYQLSTLFYGTLLGQFSFFWDRQKRLGRFLKRRLFRMSETPSVDRAAS